MARLLEDRIVLITGAGSGIGRAAALRFAAEGARVAACDIGFDSAAATADLIMQAGGEAAPLAVDVASADSVDALFDAVVALWGGVDIALNNAGIGATGELLADIAEADFDRLMSINLKGVWLCMRREIPLMVARGGGVIVNSASALGLIAMPRSSPYVAAKHAVVGLTKAAALEYAAAGVRVNAVCPGVIDTPLVQAGLADSDVNAALRALHPVGRFGQPNDVVEAMLWLASPAASFVNGISLPVDGGWTAH